MQIQILSNALFNNMEVLFFIFSSLLLANGARITRDAEDDCMQPPENKDMVSCCEMPRMRIWGDIRDSIHECAQKMGDKEGIIPVHKGKKPGKRHYFKHRIQDGCFVECLFEREGFLIDGRVDEKALLERLQTSMNKRKEWQKVAVEGFNKCVSSDLTVPANETCRSGSAEIFRCIYRELFMQCPYWLQGNEYCTSLKEFYGRCPNGPPPEVFPRRKHHNKQAMPDEDPTEEEDDSLYDVKEEN